MKQRPKLRQLGPGETQAFWGLLGQARKALENPKKCKAPRKAMARAAMLLDRAATMVFEPDYEPGRRCSYISPTTMERCPNKRAEVGVKLCKLHQRLADKAKQEGDGEQDLEIRVRGGGDGSA